MGSHSGRDGNKAQALGLHWEYLGRITKAWKN